MSKVKHGSTTFTATYTLAATSAAGYANDVAYAAGGYALSATTADDGCAHPATVKGNAVTDHSAKTLTLVGTNADGVAITETMAAPNGTATVTSTKRYKTLTSVTISSTTGADTFDIGWTSLASTPWVLLNCLQSHFAVGVGVVLVSGSANYDLERTYDEVDAAAPVAYNDGTMAAKTASSEVGLTTPVKGIRLDVNSHTSGVLRFTVLQGNR